METRARIAEKGWNAERALTAELKKKDINFLGLRLDITCGLGAMVGVVTPGEPGASLGFGCVVGG